MIFVKKIIWLSEEAKEADVILSDGKLDVLCFSCPYNSDTSLNVLYALDTDNVEIADNSYNITSINNSYRSFIIGKVLSVDDKIVGVNDYRIILDYLPSYVKVDDNISFYTSRLDLF